MLAVLRFLPCVQGRIGLRYPHVFARHSGEGPLLSGENEVLQKCAVIAPGIEKFPWKFSASTRHSSESWNPVPLRIFKSLDSSFHWNDVVLAFPQERRKISPDSSGRRPESGAIRCAQRSAKSNVCCARRTWAGFRPSPE
jgi:hypothetical protein